MENEIIEPIVPAEGEKEIWKVHPILTQYELSTFGNIRNAKTKYQLTPQPSCRGYQVIKLTRGIDRPNGRVFKIHRLMGETFYGLAPVEDMEIDHLDRNRMNNYYKNIRWATREENLKNRKKKNRPRVFMDGPAIVLLSRDDNSLIKEYPNLQQIVDELGLSPFSVRDNIHGLRFPFKIGQFMIKSEYEQKFLKET